MRSSKRLLFLVSLSFLWAATPCMFQALGFDGACIVAQGNTPPEGSTAYYELNIRQNFKSGNWAGGKKLLDEAIQKYPQMSAFHELMGKYYSHLADGEAPVNATAKYDKARYHLIRAINIDEKNVQARFLMLHVETETKHYSSAIVYCNDLLEENPYNEDLWRKKIDLYRHLGNNAEADRLLERLYTIYPGDDQLRKDLVERMSLKSTAQRDNGDSQGQEQSLRQLIDIDPKNPDHYFALTNLLYRLGRIDEAAEVAGQGAATTSRAEFVEKRASMLCEMNRHREAVEYVRSIMGQNKNGGLARLLKQLETDAARASQYNDVYISYAKLYESQHTMEALDFLVNTSIERWYLDDALMYIEESLKRKGESKKMLYNQYLINKRLGNTRKANTLLKNLHERYPEDEGITEEAMIALLDDAKELMDQDQYAEAAPILESVLLADAYPYIKEAATQRLYNCYYQSKQYAKAEKMLGEIEGFKRITQTAALYNAWGKPKLALDFLASAYAECPESDTDTRNLIANSYEEISLPYVKDLLATNRVTEANKQLKEAVGICPDNMDLLRYGINAAQRKGETAAVAQYIAKGRSLYPNDPYFILKEAQQRHLSGDHRSTLDEIAPLLQEYAGDSLLTSLYVESSIDIANECLRDKQPDEALRIIRAALDIDPENPELYYVQGQAYEYKKEWIRAYESYKHYKPGYAEVAEHKHHLEELFQHTFRNAISLEYQQARPGDADIISGNAYINYSRICNNRTNFNVGMAYAGRDGASDSKDTEMTRGGTGVQFSGGLEHAFTGRFTGKVELAGATRYFPIVMARLTGTYDLKRDWMVSAYACYRLLRSYSGVYGWQRNIVGYDNLTPIYGDPEYVRTGWSDSKKSMLQIGASASKTIEKFILSGEVSGLLFAKHAYFNANAKMKFFPVEGKGSHLFAVIGLGTAPESSLIDRSMPVGFDKLNTFVGCGGSYFVNRWLTLDVSGAWYTMLSQSERLSTSYIATDPLIEESYRNNFYIHASAQISF